MAAPAYTLMRSSMIKQKPGAVDEGPGEVLDDGEAFVLGLAAAGFGVFAKLHQKRIELDRLLGGGEGGFEFGEFGVRGQRRGGGDGGLLALPEFGVVVAVVIE